jgi:flagellar motility protein MotE (MotC chaperone)
MKNPIVLAAIGLVLSLVTGLGWFWFAARSVLAEAAAHKPEKVEKPKPEAPWDFWTIEIDNLSAELKGQKDALRKREESVAAREARVVAEREELAKLRKQLEGMRAEISGRMVEIEAEEARNLKTLANTYSNLTPKSAIAIFREMDDAMVVKILSLMKADVVSALFEEMGKGAASDPAMARRAAAISEKLRLLSASK